MAYCNPELASLITETLGGDKWITEAYQLEGLRKHASDKKFQAKWRDVKLAKKERLAGKIKVTPQTLINCNFTKLCSCTKFCKAVAVLCSPMPDKTCLVDFACLT